MSWLPFSVRPRWTLCTKKAWTRYYFVFFSLDFELISRQLLSDLIKFYPDNADHNAHSLGVPALDALLEVFAPKASGSSALNDGQYQDYRVSGQDQLGRFQAAVDEKMLLHSEIQDEDLHISNETHAAHDDSGPPVNALFSDPDGMKKRPTPIVEVSSCLSSSGKSQLLYYLAAIAILPRTFGDIAVGGHEAAVIFIDTDDRFDAERLRVVARGIMQERRRSDLNTGEQSTRLFIREIESLLVSSLQHVHVLRPQSSSSLLATLHSLDSYLFDLSRHRSVSRPLQMIAIDSVTAFIWQDRLRDEVARTEEIGRPREEVDRAREQKQRFYLSDLYAELAKELKRLQSQFQCAIVYTSTVSGGRAAGLGFYDQSQTRTPSLKPALPAPWGTLPTLRLIVHRSTIRPFPPSMAPQAAVKDAPSRQSVVRQGKFSAWVNAWGQEEWPRRIVEAIEASNGGSFSFYVREYGVDIQP
jgi:hypothetical protein